MEWYSVEQVADRLGLHVRTVRGYIRDGRLTAVRIGKQYRIAQADLDALTGREPEPERNAPTAEVSTVVDLAAVDRATADRLSTFVVAGAQGHDEALRIQAIYDDRRGTLKLIILGSVAATADVLHTLDALLTADNNLGATHG